MESNPQKNPYEDALANTYKFGLLIVSARKRAGIEVEEAARFMGLNATVILSWEEGLSFPSLENLARLLDIYKISQEKIQVFVNVLNLSKQASHVHKTINKEVLKVKKPKINAGDESHHQPGTDTRGSRKNP